MVYHQFYIVFECYKIKEIKGVIERVRESDREIEKERGREIKRETE